jgi:hypothetical protein
VIDHSSAIVDLPPSREISTPVLVFRHPPRFHIVKALSLIEWEPIRNPSAPVNFRALRRRRLDRYRRGGVGGQQQRRGDGQSGSGNSPKTRHP